jgi:hypothetical protein
VKNFVNDEIMTVSYIKIKLTFYDVAEGFPVSVFR